MFSCNCKKTILLIILLLSGFAYSGGKVNIRYIDGRVVATCNISAGGIIVPANVVIDLGMSAPAVLHSDLPNILNVSQGDDITFDFPGGSSIHVHEFANMDLSQLNGLNQFETDEFEHLPFWAMLGYSAFSGSDQIMLDIQDQIITYGNQYRISNDALTIKLEGQGETDYFVNFKPRDDYILKGFVCTSMYESKLDSICAAIADMPRDGFKTCDFGSVDIMPYAAVRAAANFTNSMPDYDAVVGNNFWQNFRVIFDYQNSSIFLEKKAGVVPDLDINEYYIFDRENDYDNMSLFLKLHPDSPIADTEALVLLRHYLSTENKNFVGIESLCDSIFTIFPPEYATELIAEQIGKLPKNDQIKGNIIKILEIARNKINTSNDFVIKKHIIEARLGNLFIQTGNVQKGYEYLLSAIFNQPDNPEINYLLGLYYQRQGQDIRAWFRYFKATVSHKPYKLAFTKLQELSNSVEFRSKFDMTDTHDLFVSHKPYFFPGLADMNWKEDCSGLLEYFVFTDGRELSGIMSAIDAIDRYCYDSGLTSVCYFVDNPDYSSLACDYSNSLLQKYSAFGRPSVYINGKSYGFSSDELASPEKIIENLYSVKDMFNIVQVKTSVAFADNDNFELIITQPARFKCHSYDILLVENNVLYYAGDKLEMLNNVCRIAIDQLEYYGANIRKTYSFKDIQSRFENRINKIETEKKLNFNWKSLYLDPYECYVLLRFYDTGGILCGLGHAPLKVRGGEYAR